jgi:hypothetical protein
MEMRPLIPLLACALLPLAAPAQAIDLEQPPARWQAIFAALTVRDAMTVDFTEFRRNPFHRHVARHAGTIRWAPELGLSISYGGSDPLVVRIHADAVHLHRAGGSERLRGGADQRALMQMFGRLFAWDRAWLARSFAARGEIDAADNWTLRLNPADTALAQGLVALTLEGAGPCLRRILVGLPGGRSVDIRLAEPAFQPNFPEDVLHAAFPATDD